MQYHSCFNAITKPTQPTTIFLSNNDSLPEFGEDTIEEVFRAARTTLGGGFQLNPVRGQTEEKYFFTQMRNAFTSRAVVPAIDNTVIGAALRTDENYASLASDGVSTEWEVFEYAISAAIYYYPLKRNFVINPGLGHAQMLMPTFAVTRRSSANWFGYYLDAYLCESGKTPTLKSYVATLNWSGNYDVTPSYEVTDAISMLDCMFATRYDTSSSGQSLVWANNKVTDSFYSPEMLFEPETVNIHFGLFPFSATAFWKFERDIDFTVDSDLVPGTRPFIDFPKTHTEL